MSTSDSKLEEGSHVSPSTKEQPKDKYEVDTKEDRYEVDLKPHEHPQHKSVVNKWIITLVVSMGSLYVTAASSAPSFTEMAVSKELHVSGEVSILAMTLYILGLGIGPLLTGPLSEVFGRNILFRLAFILLTILTFGCAFAPHIAVLLVFRFITGTIAATFLSVSGGAVSDLFEDREVTTPMGFWVLSTFVGPIIGPVYSGFVNQHTDWRWTYYVLIIWAFVQTIALFVFVPETFVPVLKKWKAEELRKSTGDNNYWAPLERRTESLTGEIIVSCYRPFQLLAQERMPLLLNTWAALILGILYLTFQAFPIVLGGIHHFTVQEIGLSFIGTSVGEIIGFLFQPYFNRFLLNEANKAGQLLPPPEARLYAAEIGGVCIPISLYMIAFTSYPQVHWIAPIIGSALFGLGVYLVFSSVFTYLVVSYRPIAASAVASNAALISIFGSVFPLFAGQMYERLGPVGATALLAGLTTIAAPLPFIYRRIGARMRAKSHFTGLREPKELK